MHDSHIYTNSILCLFMCYIKRLCDHVTSETFVNKPGFDSGSYSAEKFHMLQLSDKLTIVLHSKQEMSSENKLVFYVNGREVSFHASNVDYYVTWITMIFSTLCWIIQLLGLYQSIILFAITCLLDHSRSNCEVTIQHSTVQLSQI